MKNISEISDQYGPSFMRKRQYLSWRAPIICNTIKDILAPESVLDLGCGHADLVKGFRDIGVLAYGVEGSYHVLKILGDNQHWVFIRDICEPIKGVPKCDLILCVEVFSVIDPEFHMTIIENIKQLGERVILGVSENKRFGIEEKMKESSFIRYPDVEEKIKEQIDKWKRKPAIKAFYYGMMYFEKSIL